VPREAPPREENDIFMVGFYGRRSSSVGIAVMFEGIAEARVAKIEVSCIGWNFAEDNLRAWSACAGIMHTQGVKQCTEMCGRSRCRVEHGRSQIISAGSDWTV
jgi:hypothetical protein